MQGATQFNQSNNYEYLKQSLLSLNSSEIPFQVNVEGDEIKVKWKIVDAQWIQIFAKAGLSKQYELRFKLSNQPNTLDYEEVITELSWEDGVPKTNVSASFFKGKSFNMSSGKAWGVKPDLTVGKVYDYDFSTEQIKQPIFQVISDQGWKVNHGIMGSALNINDDNSQIIKKIVFGVVGVMVIISIAIVPLIISSSVNVKNSADQVLADFSSGSLNKVYQESIFDDQYSFAEFQKMMGVNTTLDITKAELVRWSGTGSVNGKKYVYGDFNFLNGKTQTITFWFSIVAGELSLEGIVGGKPN